MAILNLFRLVVAWLLQFLRLSKSAPTVKSPLALAKDSSATGTAPTPSSPASEPTIVEPPVTLPQSPAAGQSTPLPSPTSKKTPTPEDSSSTGPSQDAVKLGFTPGGLYQHPDCTLIPAFSGRVGGRISPRAVVVHTTDTLTGTKSAIERSWRTTAGAGDCAHFIIGRDSMSQMVDIYHNANHAGGSPHGNFRQANGTLVHPNTMCIGIEIEAGGYLGRQKMGKWVHPDTKRVLDPQDVFVDQYGVGWHLVTTWQLTRLQELLETIKSAGLMSNAPGLVVADGGYAANSCAYYAPVGDQSAVVGHVTLDPVNKTDPGPQVMGWLRQKGWVK